MAVLFRHGSLRSDANRVSSTSLYVLEWHRPVQSRPHPSDPSAIQPHALDRSPTVCAPDDAPRRVVARSESCVNATDSVSFVCVGRVFLARVVLITVRL